MNDQERMKHYGAYTVGGQIIAHVKGVHRVLGQVVKNTFFWTEEVEKDVANMLRAAKAKATPPTDPPVDPPKE